MRKSGGVPERPKGRDWKSRVRAKPAPRVRIPPPPPSLLSVVLILLLFSKLFAGELVLKGSLGVSVCGVCEDGFKKGSMNFEKRDRFILKKGFLRGSIFFLKIKDGKLLVERGPTSPRSIYLLVPYIVILSSNGYERIDISMSSSDGSFSGSFKMRGEHFSIEGKVRFTNPSGEGKLSISGRVEKNSRMLNFNYRGSLTGRFYLSSGFSFREILDYVVEGLVSW